MDAELKARARAWLEARGVEVWVEQHLDDLTAILAEVRAETEARVVEAAARHCEVASVLVNRSDVSQEKRAFGGELLLRVAVDLRSLAPADYVAVRRDSGAAEIVAERQRQIDVEGWTSAHDAKHDNWELSRAACCYGEMGAGGPHSHPTPGSPPPGWPWDRSWWKPSADPVRNLVRAGALIAAEIDRIRAALSRAGKGE